MPHGFSCDEVSVFLDVSPTKAKQAWDPAIEKVAKALAYDHARTLRLLLDLADEYRPMSPAEEEQLAGFLNGRGNGQARQALPRSG